MTDWVNGDVAWTKKKIPFKFNDTLFIYSSITLSVLAVSHAFSAERRKTVNLFNLKERTVSSILDESVAIIILSTKSSSATLMHSNIPTVYHRNLLYF